jgi:crotonobetainyl-CoA:carnitine CoA-transferase CaiB-like acyl-CoA transferase
VTGAERPLEGMKVLDLSRFLAGPYCTMVLADLGADVVKVERVGGGDDTRMMGPHVNGESYPFAMANRNKRSIALDLKDPAGIAILQELAGWADVVVENFRPGVADRLGIGFAALSALNPRLIYCSISGYGQTGPDRDRGGFDIIAQGLSGFMRMTGHPDMPPVKVGFAVSDISAGVTAAYSILAASIQCQRTGRGQLLDIALVDAGLAWTMWEASKWFGAGEVPEPTGSRHRLAAPYQAYRTADGYVTIGADFQLWERACRSVFEREDWLTDPRFSDPRTRLANVDELEQEIERITVTRPTAHWVERLDAAGIPGGAVLRYDEALATEQALARGVVTEVDHPTIGTMKVLAPAPKFSAAEVSVRTPAPLLGEHTREVLAAIGHDPASVDALEASGVVLTTVRP